MSWGQHGSWSARILAHTFPGVMKKSCRVAVYTIETLSKTLTESCRIPIQSEACDIFLGLCLTLECECQMEVFAK
jgi:hypothetical protein